MPIRKSKSCCLKQLWMNGTINSNSTSFPGISPPWNSMCCQTISRTLALCVQVRLTRGGGTTDVATVRGRAARKGFGQRDATPRDSAPSLAHSTIVHHTAINSMSQQPHQQAHQTHQTNSNIQHQHQRQNDMMIIDCSPLQKITAAVASASSPLGRVK